MQKKVAALALAAAFAAPLAAQAQSSNVTIYGFLKPSFDYIDVDGDKGSFVQTNNSLIGFSGSEDLGNGLKAIFQLESQLDFDERGDSGDDGQWVRRDSWLGLSGGFGSLTVGNHQTAYVRSSAALDPLADTIGDYNNIMAVYGNEQQVDFNRRVRNSFYYTSPKMGGFQVLASYALDGEGLDFDEDDSDPDDDNVISVAAVFAGGPFSVIVAYEDQGKNAADFKAFKLGGSLTFGTTTISALAERIKAGEDAVEAALGVDSEAERDAFFVGLKHSMGKIDLLGSFIVAKDSDVDIADDDEDLDDGAKAWAVGVAYNFSKRTSITGLYAHVNNDDDGTYFMDAGYPVGEAGDTIKGVSVRLAHRF